jgi:hypothetical protein
VKTAIRIARLLLLGLAWQSFYSSTNGQSDEEKTELAGLKVKYAPDNNLYLAYSVIYDLTALLHNTTKLNQIDGGDNEHAAYALAKFLNDNNDKINKSLTFLQIDLGTLMVSFKKADDRSAGIQTVKGWSPGQVIKIAVICDKYFNGTLAIQKLSDSIAARKLTIAEAWDGYQKADADAYVPDSRIGALKVDIRQLIKTHRNELRELASKDKTLFERVQQFAERFDLAERTTLGVIAEFSPIGGTLTFVPEGTKKPVTYTFSVGSTAVVDVDGVAIDPKRVIPGHRVGIRYSETGLQFSPTKIVVGETGSSKQLEKIIAELIPP